MEQPFADRSFLACSLYMTVMHLFTSLMSIKCNKNYFLLVNELHYWKSCFHCLLVGMSAIAVSFPHADWRATVSRLSNRKILCLSVWKSLYVLLVYCILTKAVAFFYALYYKWECNGFGYVHVIWWNTVVIASTITAHTYAHLLPVLPWSYENAFLIPQTEQFQIHLWDFSVS